MAARAEKTDPKLWEKVKRRVMRGSKGGDPGEWSARKAQLAVGEYKKEGGGYRGGKSADNSLSRWTKEEWGTRSGKPSGKTGERYLPKAARQQLSESEYERTTAKKRADAAKGRQFSAQPKDVARKTAASRKKAGGTGRKPAATTSTPSVKRAAPTRKTPAKKPAAASRRATTKRAAPRKTVARKPATRKAPSKSRTRTKA